MITEKMEFVIGQSYKHNDLINFGAEEGNNIYEHETQDAIGKSAIHISTDHGNKDMWFVYHYWTTTDGYFKLVYKQ